jgi:lambda repressor-like predicted transcriptional regulator
MTKLGKYFMNKSLNKANISRKTGIKTSRLSHLSRKESAKLTAEELHLIALAIGVEPTEILTELYGHLKLKC